MPLQSCLCSNRTEASNAVFTFSGGNSTGISVNFMNINNHSWVPVTVLGDSGSDITLLRREDGERLGMNPSVNPNTFPVGGVGAGSVMFARFETFIKIKGLPPAKIPLGIAVERDAIRDNLMGREGVLDTYNITFEKNSVTFTPREARHEAYRCCNL